MNTCKILRNKNRQPLSYPFSVTQHIALKKCNITLHYYDTCTLYLSLYPWEGKEVCLFFLTAIPRYGYVAVDFSISLSMGI